MEQIERKFQIGYGEKFKESLYSNDEVAALFFFWNPTQGPFVIIPSMEQKEKVSNYKLTIFSNNPVELRKLEENKNQTLVGKWELDINAGGCHLYEEKYEKDSSKRTWTQNPKFNLIFTDPVGPAWVKITLVIAEANWKGRIKNTVGGMLGIYLINKTERKMRVEDLVQQPNFMPVNVLTEEYGIQEINPNGYIIMPCTYQVIFYFYFFQVKN